MYTDVCFIILYIVSTTTDLQKRLMLQNADIDFIYLIKPQRKSVYRKCVLYNAKVFHFDQESQT